MGRDYPGFQPKAHSWFSGIGLSFAPDLANEEWFKAGIWFFLTVVAPATLFINGALMVQGFLDWTNADCWGCNAWPDLSKPSTPWRSFFGPRPHLARGMTYTSPTDLRTLSDRYERGGQSRASPHSTD